MAEHQALPKEETPVVEKSGSPASDTVERHPAYAQIGAHRVNGKAHLYGSDFTHHNFVTITVHRSELHRGLSQDWAHTREEYIEVALSEAQWAAFVSSMNVGGGVQCTLLAKDGRYVPRLPTPKKRTDQFEGELNESLAVARDALTELVKLNDEGRIMKSQVRDLAGRALRALTSSLPFVAKQFEEHMEDTVQKAKTEVNAYVQGTIARLGLAALKDQAPLSLEDK